MNIVAYISINDSANQIINYLRIMFMRYFIMMSKLKRNDTTRISAFCFTVLLKCKGFVVNQQDLERGRNSKEAQYNYQAHMISVITCVFFLKFTSVT